MRKALGIFAMSQTIDTNLFTEFIESLPDYLHVLVSGCRIKATSCPESRSIVLLAPDYYHARCLLAQPELGRIARGLGVTSLRVICLV
jgi:hypothetical protein